jgi:hypothetical protein
MGIDIDGGMIVGAKMSDLSEEAQNKVSGLFSAGEMDCMFSWYDAAIKDCVVGYKQPNVIFDEEPMNDWLLKVFEDAVLFEATTGTKAKLIGMQDVW